MKNVTINGITGLSKNQFGMTYVTKSFYKKLIKTDVNIKVIETDCYIDSKDCVQIEVI